MKITIFLFLLTLCQNLFSAGHYSIKVQQGDQIVSFDYNVSKKNELKSKEKKVYLSKINSKYLQNKIIKIKKMNSNLKSFCFRNYIEFIDFETNSNKIGCIGSKNKTARALTDLANSMSNAIHFL